MDKRKTIEKIIDAVEHPENPARREAVSSHEHRERRLERNERIFRLIFNLAFFVLLAILMFRGWQQSTDPTGKWISLISGSVMGMLICLVAERSKAGTQRTLSPRATTLSAISIIAVGLLVSWLKGFVEPLSMAAIKLTGSSFLLIVWGYATFVSWKKLEE